MATRLISLVVAFFMVASLEGRAQATHNVSSTDEWNSAVSSLQENDTIRLTADMAMGDIPGEACVITSDDGSKTLTYGSNLEMTAPLTFSNIKLDMSCIYANGHALVFDDGVDFVGTYNGNLTGLRTVWGGSETGTVAGTSVILKSGTFGWVYAGGNLGAVEGEAKMELSGSVTVNGTVFGGGDAISATCGKTHVEISGGTYGYVYGGGWEGPVTGTAQMLITGGTYRYIHAGGGGVKNDAEKGRVGATDLVIKNLDSPNTVVYGGGWAGSVTGNVNVFIENSTLLEIYGSSFTGTVEGDVDVVFKGGKTDFLGAAGRQGAGEPLAVKGTMNVTIENGMVTKDVSSGNSPGGGDYKPCTLTIRNSGDIQNPYRLPAVFGMTDLVLDNSTVTFLPPEFIQANNAISLYGFTFNKDYPITISGDGELVGEQIIFRGFNVPETWPEDVSLVIAGNQVQNATLGLYDRISNYDHDNIVVDTYPLYKAGNTYRRNGQGNLKEVIITPPAEGTFSVVWEDADRAIELESGDQVPAGSELALSLTPADGYQGGTIHADDHPWAASTYTVTDNVTFSVDGFSAIPYIVTVAPAANGKIVANPNTDVIIGTEVSLTISPDDGYRLKNGSLKVYKTDDESTTVAVAGDSFNQPAYHVTVTAEFEQIPYQITISSMENGNITASPSVDITEGVEVALTVSPADGYRLKSGSLQIYKTGDANTTVALSGNSFRMPAYDVTVMAEFEGIPAPPPPVYYTVTLPSVEGATTDPAPGDYEVESWENFRFYLTLDEDYNQSEPIVTTDRGETITPRSSDGAYIVKYIRSDVEIFIDGVVKNPDPVANETVDTGGIKIYTANGYLHIQAPQPEQVHIFTPDGRLLKAFRTSGNEEQIALPKGIYLIRVTNQCVKVVL